MKRTEKFKIGELFVQLRGKESSPNKVPNGNVNMVNEISANNGIAKKATSNTVFEAPAITVSVNFATNVFLQDEPFCASVNILILQASWMKLYPKTSLYICALLRKNNAKYNYQHKISKDRLNDTDISLPILTASDLSPLIDSTHTYSSQGFIPDFAYMEHYIAELEAKRVAELEAERVAELEAYLRAADLDNYELTDDDREVLEKEEKGEIRKKEFTIGELFELLPIKYMLSKQDLDENSQYPAYSSDTTNGGIIGYTDKPEFIPSEQHPVFVIFGDHTRTMNIATTPFAVLDNVKVMTPKYKELNKAECLLYIFSIWHKMIPNQGYARHWSIAKQCSISLPIDSEGNICFAYMEKYIKAIEKLSVAGVVRYKDRVIEETKKLIA